MKPESFYSPFFELFSFCSRVCMRGKANRDQSFSWNRVQKISNISFIKKTNSVAPSLYSSFFFPLLFLFLSTNIFLFASQFYGNSFVDFGTCCYTYNPSIVAVAKSSIAAVLFSPISKHFICLFFLLPHKAASHTGDFYCTFFQESLSRAACLPPSLELSRDFYRENFGVVKSIYSTLSSFFSYSAL